MLKLLLCGVLIACTTLIAKGFSDALAARIRELKAILHMLDEIVIFLQYSAYTLEETLTRLSQTKELGTLEFLQRPVSPYTAREEIQSHIAEWDCALSADEQEQLSRFFGEFGTSDTAGQLSLTQMYRTGFARSLEQLTEKSRSSFRLYRSLGVLSGVFLSILLI